YISVALFDDRSITVVIRDRGCGIPDVELARQPLYTTNTDGERSGMGFSVMETFTDRLSVRSRVGVGTGVTMKKCLK
ncbi:MAG: ATP-binding protein, partial [Clostridia bacterium]|nr:ATP-binding protein [Clostridia bacterium]